MNVFCKTEITYAVNNTEVYRLCLASLSRGNVFNAFAKDLCGSAGVNVLVIIKR